MSFYKSLFDVTTSTYSVTIRFFRRVIKTGSNINNCRLIFVHDYSVEVSSAVPTVTKLDSENDLSPVIDYFTVESAALLELTRSDL